MRCRDAARRFRIARRSAVVVPPHTPSNCLQGCPEPSRLLRADIEGRASKLPIGCAGSTMRSHEEALSRGSVNMDETADVDDVAAADANREGISRRAVIGGAGAVGGAVLTASLLPTAVAAQTARRTDPIAAVRYSLIIDGAEFGSFSELSAMTTEIEPDAYLPSSDTGATPRKLSGKLKPPTITLIRAFSGATELSTWHEAARRGQPAAARKSASLVVYGPDGSRVAQYHLENAWPSKIEVGGLKAGSNQVLIERVTLVMDSLQRVSV